MFPKIFPVLCLIPWWPISLSVASGFGQDLSRPSCDFELVLGYFENIIPGQAALHDKGVWAQFQHEFKDQKALLTHHLLKSEQTATRESLGIDKLLDHEFYRQASKTLLGLRLISSSKCQGHWLCLTYGLCGTSSLLQASECSAEKHLFECSFEFLAAAYQILLDNSLLDADERLLRECMMLRQAALSNWPNVKSSQAHRFLKERFDKVFSLVQSQTVGSLSPNSSQVWQDALDCIADSSFLLAVKYPDLGVELKSWLDLILDQIDKSTFAFGSQASPAESYRPYSQLDDHSLTGSAYFYFFSRYTDFLNQGPLEQRIEAFQNNTEQLTALLRTGVLTIGDTSRIWTILTKESKKFYDLFEKSQGRPLAQDRPPVEEDGLRIWLLAHSTRLLMEGIRFSLDSPNFDDGLAYYARQELHRRAEMLGQHLFFLRDRVQDYQELVCFSEAIFKEPQVLNPEDQFAFHAFMAKVNYALGRTKQASDHLKQSGSLVTLDVLVKFKKDMRYIGQVLLRPCREDEWQP